MKYKVTQKQYNSLSGLAYRIADNAYMIERYGAKDTEIERAENHLTILDLFDELDNSGVPFWVQNAVMCWAENWRVLKTDYLVQFLTGRGVDCSAVSII